MKTEKLYFKIHGDFLTNFMRDLCLEPNITHAIEVFKTLSDDLEIFKNIIMGEQEFTGINDLTLEKSNNNSIYTEIANHIQISGNCDEATAFCKLFDLNTIDFLEVIFSSLPDKDILDTPNAWVSPNGKIIEVGIMAHDSFVYKIHNSLSKYFFTPSITHKLFETRFIRVSGEHVRRAESAHDITHKQIKIMNRMHKFSTKTNYHWNISGYFAEGNGAKLLFRKY